MGYSVPSKDRMPRGPQAEWHSILRGTLYRIGHERSLSNRLRTWSHPRRISFLRGDCIFAFQFFSSHLEITLLFCLRHFLYCTHAYELQCFAESASPRGLSQLMRKQP